MEISHCLKKYSYLAYFHLVFVSMVSVRTWKTYTLFDTHFGEVSNVYDKYKFQNSISWKGVEMNEVTFNSNICKVVLIYFLKTLNNKTFKLNRMLFNSILNL